MCSRIVLAVAGIWCVARPLAAQRRTDADQSTVALLARAESLSSEWHKLDRARVARSATGRRGQVLQAGKVIVVAWESASPEMGQRLAALVDSTVEAFGGGPAELLDHVVAIQVNTSDSARILTRPSFARRRPIGLDWGVYELRHPEAGASRLLDRFSREYRSSLDSGWQHWLPFDFGIEWDPKVHGYWALASLTNPDVAVGQGCLAGRVAQCRLWLGLDDDARPIAMRYRPDEIRRRIVGWTSWVGLADRQQCGGGDDAACVRYAEAYPAVSVIPAPAVARASFVRALWAMHGPQVVARAFGDTHGSIGERFARAASIREDSLVAEWRSWTLARGRPDHLAASLPQSLIVLLIAGLAVWAATRTGRWR
jgi:hypothetical protein